MDGMYGVGGVSKINDGVSIEGAFWGLPVAFALDDDVRDRIGRMTDEEREVLKEKSFQAKNDTELDELVRMVAEGKFE